MFDIEFNKKFQGSLQFPLLQMGTLRSQQLKQQLANNQANALAKNQPNRYRSSNYASFDNRYLFFISDKLDNLKSPNKKKEQLTAANGRSSQNSPHVKQKYQNYDEKVNDKDLDKKNRAKYLSLDDDKEESPDDDSNENSLSDSASVTDSKPKNEMRTLGFIDEEDSKDSCVSLKDNSKRAANGDDDGSAVVMQSLFNDRRYK